jgi:hypothetical protein
MNLKRGKACFGSVSEILVHGRLDHSFGVYGEAVHHDEGKGEEQRSLLYGG